MDPELYVSRILDDESLAGDLDEAEATKLVEWLVNRATAEATAAASESDADARIDALRATGRGVAKVVAAWRDGGSTAGIAAAHERQLPAPPKTLTTPAAVLDWLIAAKS